MAKLVELPNARAFNLVVWLAQTFAQSRSLVSVFHLWRRVGGYHGRKVLGA